MQKDLNKFLLSQSISSSFQQDYFRKIQKKNTTSHLLESNGLPVDIFSKLSIDTPIIFTTAYNEYAIKAFKVNSIDYLLKPIGIEDLRVSIQKFEKLNNAAQQKINAEKLDTAFNIINKQYDY